MKAINGQTAGEGVGNAARAGRLPALLAAAALVILLAAPVTAQVPVRLWAAQTGPNEVTVTWDSIPGTSDYLIYAAPVDSVVGNLRMKPPLQRLSGRSRGATLYGIRRLSGGITLVAMAANGHVIQKAQFNAVTPATSFSPVQPPEEVTAEVSGPTEITLSWTPVPGATAYYIGRAVAPGGFSTLCTVCSAEPRYVDHDVLPGAATSYTVAAIFPNGKSRPAPSNEVTPGATQVATTVVSVPTTSSKVLPGPCGSCAPATTSTTGSATTTTSTTTIPTSTPTSAAAPDTAQASSTGLMGSVINAVSGAVGTLTGAVKPPAAVTAVSPAPASVRLTWQPSPTAGVTDYRISRRINAGSWQLLSTVGPTILAYSDAFFPTTLFASGAASVSYSVVAVQNNISSSAAMTGTLSVQAPPSTATTATTTTTTTSTTSCKLDYQRADNMWAAFGRPDGQLGTETISLAAAQNKVFITDWTYEKQRNDGTNYYGSHLRIATNSSTHSLRLQVRTLTLTSWVALAPGKTQQFQADLMDVFCEN